MFRFLLCYTIVASFTAGGVEWRSCNQAKSPPALKARPAPVRITARTCRGGYDGGGCDDEALKHSISISRRIAPPSRESIINKSLIDIRSL
jgi:hypothetical protein